MEEAISIHFRKILLSTGELVIESVINYNGREYFDSSPLGLTVGLRETQNEDLSHIEEVKITTDFLKKIGSLTQKEFDKTTEELLPSQTASSLSLAYAKILAYKQGFDEKYFFKHFQKNNLPTKKQNIKIISNILNGGRHSDSNLAFCEFMIIPQGNFIEDSIRIASEIYHDLGQILKNTFNEDQLCIGREGGYAPRNIKEISDALTAIELAINTRNSGKCHIAIDVAANNFAQVENSSFLYTIDNNPYTTEGLLGYYQALLLKHPLISYLEDPFHENDSKGWQMLMSFLGEKVLIVSDDLSVSTLKYLDQNKGLYNASILKMNQSGNLSRLLDSYEFCKKNNIETIISQRSGETDSATVSHLAIGLGSSFIKIGAPARERIVKYNELVRISDRIHTTL